MPRAPSLGLNLRAPRVIRFLLAAVFLAPTVATVRGEDAAPRPRIGLALGGGSAKGIAHVGVLKWLEEHHVPVDVIAGTSTGAFIGGAYATGLSAAEIEEMLRTADWDLIMRPDIPYRLKSFRRKEDDRDYPVKIEAGLRRGFRLQSGLNPGHRVGLLLSRVAFPYSTVSSFDDLAIPFRCVATDLEQGTAIVLDRGPLGPALRASMALPGSFDPVRLNGRLLSDGGILNNIPVDVVRGMGAGIVIAVSVGVQDREPPAETIASVANRAIGLMMADLDKPRLDNADVVILPDLQGFGSSDYRRSEDITARGYKAAEAKAQVLMAYALGEEDWASYRAAIEARRRPRNGPVTFVEVTGVNEAAAAQVARRFEGDLGLSPDPNEIESNLDWVIGLGRHASAMYDRRLRGDEEGLGIEIRDKSYGPPFVKFSLDLDNENKDVNLTLGSRITLMDVTGQGSEWRVDTSLGSTLRLSTEILQPIGGTGPLRRGAFVAPRALYSRTSEELYADGEIQAIYSRQRVGAGLDLGWIFGRTTQFRVGFETAYVRNTTRVGDALPLSRGSEQVARARFSHDSQDHAYLPSRGVRLSSSLSWTVDAPEAVRGFGVAEGGVSVAWKLKRRHQFTVSGEGGVTFGAVAPTLHQFSLGGPFRLGALPTSALRAQNFVLARAAYRTQLRRLPDLLGDRLYLTAMVEVGSAFERSRTLRLNTSYTAGLVADTLLGPFFFGASLGNRGDLRAYFIVGALVR